MRSRALTSSVEGGKTRSTDLTLPLLATAINFATGVVLNVYPASATNVARELSLSHSQTGVLISALIFGYAAVQIPGGLLSTKYGRKQLMMVALATSGVLTILFAVVPSFGLLFLIRFLMGFAIGVQFPAITHLLSEFLTGRKLQSSLAFYVAGYGASTLFTFFVLSLLLQWGGWRWMMVAAAVICGLTVLALGLFLRGPEYRRASLPSTEDWNWRDVGRLFVNVDLFYVGLLNLTGLAAQIVVLTWTPAFLQSRFSSGVLSANIITGVLGISVVASGFMGDSLATRLDKRLLILFGTLGCLLFPLLIPISPTPLIVFVLVGATGWFSFYYKPLLFSMVPRFASRELTAVGAGYVNTLGFLGTFVAPLVFGFILDRSQSYFYGYVAGTLVAASGIVGLIVLTKKPGGEGVSEVSG